MADLKPKLRVDVNHNPTKKGIKVQFVLPQTLEGDKKAEATQKLQSKLNQGLEQYNLTVSQDTDVPYANVIGFLIPIADIKLLIKNAIGGGSSEPAPEEAPAPEEPIKEAENIMSTKVLKIKLSTAYENAIKAIEAIENKKAGKMSGIDKNEVEKIIKSFNSIINKGMMENISDIDRMQELAGVKK